MFRLKTHALSARVANAQLQASMPRLNDAMNLFAAMHKVNAATASVDAASASTAEVRARSAPHSLDTCSTLYFDLIPQAS